MEKDSNLKCLFNNKLHLICVDAVQFPCNSDLFACLKCIKKKVDYANALLCLHCNQMHRFNFDQINNDDYKSRIDKEANQIAASLLNKADLLNNNLKENLIDNKEPLNNLLEHIEYEIDVRVESLKIEMQIIRHKLIDQILKFKLTKINQIQNDKTELDKILIAKSSDKIQEFEKRCLNFVNKTNSIEQAFKIMQRYNEKQTKTPNLGNHSMIGYLNSNLFNHFDEKSIKNIKIELIDLNLKSVCGLHEIYYFNNSFKKKYELVVTDFASNSINFLNNFDSYMSSDLKIQTINRLNNVRFKNYYSICSNSLQDYYLDYDDQSLFVCDMELQRLLIFDLKATRLKKIIQGKNVNKREFDCPRDVAYFNKKIYVLDQGTNSIDIFTDDGCFIQSFYFNQKSNYLIQMAWSVRVNSNLIAIIDWMSKIYLFDFDFKLITCIEQINVTSNYSYLLMI